MVVRKTQSELEKMRAAGLLVYEVLKAIEAMTVEGVTTLELEVAAEKMIKDAGARLQASTGTSYIRSWTVPDGVVRTAQW